jgi:hypothetical protein
MKYLVILVLLSDCAAPQPVFRPITLGIPVATPCRIAPVKLPDFAFAHAVPTDDAFSKTKAALIELEQRKAFEAELLSQIDQCQ